MKLTPSEFVQKAKEAGADAFNLHGDLSLYSKEEIIIALEKVAEQYPAVFRNFFLSELEKS